MMLSIFICFLRLGCLSFGGPMAHIALFREEFVVKRTWLSAESFQHLLAMCQLLPGPASSQLGFAIGLQRGGLPGAIAAFLGFTLPSFVLMVAFAQGQALMSDLPLFQTLGHWLKLFAVCIVLDAVVSLFRQFCREPRHRLIALFTALLLVFMPSNGLQLALLVAAGVVGYAWSTAHEASAAAPPQIPESADQMEQIRRWPLILFLLLFAGSLLDSGTGYLSLFALHYQAGSLVFGGGHVVLPLLQQSVADSLATDQFLNGYAAAQIIPGPMFTLASYLGAMLIPSTPWAGGAVATLAIFLPGFLLVLAILPVWQQLQTRPRLQAAIRAINASVVGLLAAALYQPLLTSAITRTSDLLWPLLAWLVWRRYQLPIGVLVGLFLAAALIDNQLL
jgi:chromate transporter